MPFGAFLSNKLLGKSQMPSVIAIWNSSMLDFVRKADKPPFLNLAFPDNHNPPTHSKQLIADGLVPFPIGCKLFAPKTFVAFWHCCISATLMPVPEATMHEYYRTVFRQYDIRPPGQVFYIFPETEAGLVKEAPYHDFGLGVS